MELILNIIINLHPLKRWVNPNRAALVGLTIIGLPFFLAQFIDFIIILFIVIVVAIPAFAGGVISAQTVFRYSSEVVPLFIIIGYIFVALFTASYGYFRAKTSNHNRIPTFAGTSSPEKSAHICRILLFGLGGVGKSQFAKRFTSISIEDTEKTKSFRILRRDETVSTGETISFLIGDSAGQKPREILQDIIKEQSNPLYRQFFGDPQNRLVNTLIVVVDLFNTDFGGNPEDIVRRNPDIIKHIHDRVERNKGAVGETVFDLLFGVVKSKKLNNVVFFINKLNILEWLVVHNHLLLEKGISPKKFAIDLYAIMIEDLDRLCKAGGIHYEILVGDIRDYQGIYSIVNDSVNKMKELLNTNERQS